MYKSLTKRELALAIAEAGELDVRDVKKMLTAQELVVSQEIANGIAVRVPGVALVKPVFLKARPKRQFINPRTGETMLAAAVPGRTKLRARPAPGLRSVLPTPRSKVGLELARNGR